MVIELHETTDKYLVEVRTVTSPHPDRKAYIINQTWEPALHL